MRKIISLVMVLLPCTAFAATNCRVIEYPDHYEAVCVGDAQQTYATVQQTGQEQSGGQELILESSQTTETVRLDLPPEKIVRNDLARSYGAYWLKARQGR